MMTTTIYLILGQRRIGKDHETDEEDVVMVLFGRRSFQELATAYIFK